MANCEVPSCLDHVREVPRRIPQGLLLVFHGLVLRIPDQRVSPHRDDSGLLRPGCPFLPFPHPPSIAGFPFDRDRPSLDSGVAF